MKQSRIGKIIDSYLPPDTYSEDCRRMARLACENVEREVRQESVSRVYELANSLSKHPRQQEEES